MLNIDVVSLSVVVVLLIAFIIPFYLYSRKTKKQEAKALQLMADFANDQNVEIHVKDLWRRQYFIGLDQNKGKVIYSDNISTTSPILIDLNEIKQVKIEEVSRNVVSGSESRKIIDKLDLVFMNENKKVVYTLEFYAGDKFSDLSGETILIKKWETALQDMIKNKF